MSDVTQDLLEHPNLLSVVSHELRTPLTSIRGSLGLLAKGVMGDLPPDADQLVRVAEENSVRLMELVNELLDLEKIRSGRSSLRLEPVPTDAIGATVARIMDPIGVAAGVGIRVRADGLCAVVDREKIVRVLVNLVGNAVRHSPCGTTVDVDCRVFDGRLVLTVDDCGPGVPVEERLRIFEPFAQAPGSSGGTGLGLTICREIVEGHGGTIGVTSHEGGGARFQAEIPAGRLPSSDE